MLRLIVALLALLAAVTAVAQERLRAVATTTDLRSLVQAVGGDLVNATSLVSPSLDAEDYQPRAPDLARLKAARLVVRVGLDYDLWLDRLLAQAGNASLMRGGDGYVDASAAIAVLDVRGSAVGAAAGHAHGSGNPHYWLDPKNAEIITGHVLEALARIDPANAKRYESNRLVFLGRLETKLREWEQRASAFSSVPLVAYHNTWAYFARRFRLRFVGFIEIRAGVPASASQLAKLLQTMRDEQVRLIVRQPGEPSRDADFLAQRSGARIVVLAGSVGALPGTDDYLSLFDANIAALEKAHAS